MLAPVVPHNYITEVRQVGAATGKADAAGEEVSGVEPAATVGVMEPSPKILCLISAVFHIIRLNQTALFLIMEVHSHKSSQAFFLPLSDGHS